MIDCSIFESLPVNLCKVDAAFARKKHPGVDPVAVLLKELLSSRATDARGYVLRGSQVRDKIVAFPVVHQVFTHFLTSFL